MSRDDFSGRQEELEEILAELMRTIDGGKSINRDAWTTKHPDFAAELKEFFDKHEHMEQLARPLRQAAARELHVRCPHCHNPIELLEEVQLTDISCPSCGSSFSLASDMTISHYQPGEKTIGHFQLLDRVGVGQFGTVWKARDTKLDRTVAVKIPRHGQLDGAQTELFLRDARAAAQLKHPNIVGVHEVGLQDDRIYIVGDFVQGATLKEWTQVRKLALRDAAELCVKIANALDHAHEAGVIHRDLKPGNIMMDTDGEPHIVDFGLAKREAGEITMTLEGQILGTPAYMSPEQARGEGHAVDRSADVYSLGVILFELLTGELPFRGENQMLILQVLNDEPPSPKKLNSHVPSDLETVCLKCLEKDPTKRYPTAQQVATELRRWLEGKSILARPPGATERVVKWARRKPAVAALVAMSALAMLFCVGLVVNFWNRSRIEAANLRLQQAILEVNTANTELEAAVTAKNVANEKLEGAVKTANDSRKVADHLRQRADKYYYISQINLTELLLAEGQTKNAWAALERLIPKSGEKDLRHIEWYYLWNKCHGQRLTLRGDESDVRSLVYGPNGKVLALASTDGTVTIFSTGDGKHLSQFELNSGPAVDLAFTRGGRSLYCMQPNGKVSRWNLMGERRPDVYDTQSNITNGRIIEHGQIFVTQSSPSAEPMVHWPNTGQDPIKLFGDKTRGPYRRSLGGSASVRRREDLLFSINHMGTRLAVAKSRSGGLVRLHDISRIQAPSTIDLEINAIGCIALSHRGRFVAVGQGLPARNRTARYLHKDDEEIPNEYQISVWDTRTQAKVVELATDSSVVSLAFSPNVGQLAATTVDQTVHLWAFPGGTALATFHCQSDTRNLEFSPAGDQLAVSDRTGRVRIWDVQDRKEPLSDLGTADGNGRRIGEVTFAKKSSQVAVQRDDLLRILDASSGDVVNEVKSPRNTYGVFAIEQKEQVVTNGEDVISLTDPGVVRKVEGKRDRVLDVAVSLNSEYLATANTQDVFVNDFRSGKLLFRFEQPKALSRSFFTAVTFAPQSTTLITGIGSYWNEDRPGQVDFWDLHSGKHLRNFARTKHSVWRLRLSPDGTKLAAATGNYGGRHLSEVLIWDFPTGELLYTLRGHSECVFDLDFSPDGKRLVSVAGDWTPRRPTGELRIWDVLTGVELLSIETENGGLLCVDFDDLGRQIVAGSARGAITLLRPRW